MSYNARKAAQTIAYFALHSGGEIPVLKAVKLVYIADRESIAQYGFPIQDERHVSMPLGPVNSTTLRYINGEMRDLEQSGWTDFLRDRANHNVALSRKGITEDDLDELSDADIGILKLVWDRFGGMGQWGLVDWTHDPNNVPEWEDPKGSSNDIPLERIMRYLGIDAPVRQSEVVQEHRRLAAVLDECRA